KHGQHTDEREKMVYLYEASRGLFYLHQKLCVHRDLAARHCLISAHGQIKIAHFDRAWLIDPDYYNKDDEISMNKAASNAPVRWRAPETLHEDAQTFSCASDIRAFGVVAYEVFSNGMAPWPADPDEEVAARIRKGG
ncbi:hypothetical protein PENTCL1PPCAC_20795, partial [Pristionchus entomophagus]